jgi:tetratricopeptide (TPR) repeat protein
MNMKYFIPLFLLFNSIVSHAQSSEDYLNSGLKKHNAKDYDGAIKDYSRAIGLDNGLRDAYYNRGVCLQAIDDKVAAKKDFDKTIIIDPKFAKAYYSRATIYVSREMYLEALPDLDKVIELDPSIPNALTLRGQIHAQTNKLSNACDDFRMAKDLGDKQAGKYLDQYCTEGKKEQLSLEWLEEENWKLADDQENAIMRVVDLIPSNETLDNWSELGNMTVMKGVVGMPVEKIVNLLFDEAKKTSPNARLTLLEKDIDAEYPWIIFVIESPSFSSDQRPESQLWYVIQGRQSLYTNFRAIRQDKIPETLRVKWTAFFKTAKLELK